jgi:hypothetical protein
MASTRKELEIRTLIMLEQFFCESHGFNMERTGDQNPDHARAVFL